MDYSLHLYAGSVLSVEMIDAGCDEDACELGRMRMLLTTAYKRVDVRKTGDLLASFTRDSDA
ncbi:hypothetical protein [Brevundimonas sp. PAMC22021]|uniref:hypothetical protein n=1 Tax=Brevundimonas sp. PAMC22021 TaxID=2861285 RepID=UPI001C62C26F|nr:hypothetical protein [Brevundimonas sp. PAMC22021]QYF87030.1 hypothetical protein KY493_00425 [Brevundimonas sp. PAMC22021]